MMAHHSLISQGFRVACLLALLAAVLPSSIRRPRSGDDFRFPACIRPSLTSSEFGPPAVSATVVRSHPDRFRALPSESEEDSDRMPEVRFRGLDRLPSPSSTSEWDLASIGLIRMIHPLRC